MANIEKISNEYSRLGNDYIFSRINSKLAIPDDLHTPFRVNGLTFMLCVKGDIQIDINLNHYELGENMIVVTGPDNIIHAGKSEEAERDCYFLFISSDFIRDTNIDLNVLSSAPASTREDFPVVRLEPEEADMILSFMNLIHKNTQMNTDEIYVRSIARNLIASLCYQMIQFGAKRTDSSEPERPRSRRATYVFEFKNLVHKYHRRERSVSFYAEKMFISPKYLSLIIKETTGRSAAEWIDEFVILEAKNMLRFSGKNIQQVAYDLNFSNQSSFGKYFKHLTGMSPSEYQRS